MNKADGQNILIVDDAPANLRLLVGLLAEQRYQVRPVNNGKQAISGAKAIIPDLVLLDIDMPEMDGYEVCRQLKADVLTCEIPIIFISALNNTGDKIRAFEMGGVDYITKPFQADEVLARVKTHLTISRLQKQLAQANAHLQQQVDEERRLNGELQGALDQIKILSGLVPICSCCKNIRDDEGFWHQIESYLHEHSDMVFSHGICPSCVKKLYPEFYDKQ